MQTELYAGIAEFLNRCSLPGHRTAELSRLEDLRLLLEDANKATNLTRITSPNEYWCKHVADSLSIGLCIPEVFTKPLRLADVGSGAGFPLLPLAWANPGLDAVAIESKQRKAAFIEDAAAKLGFKNCSAIAHQVREVCDMDEYRGTFDIVVARAVGTADKLIRESHRLLSRRRGAKLILYKTPRQVAREKKAFECTARDCRLKTIYSAPFELPFEAGARQFAVAYA